MSDTSSNAGSDDDEGYYDISFARIRPDGYLIHPNDDQVVGIFDRSSGRLDLCAGQEVEDVSDGEQHGIIKNKYGEVIGRAIAREKNSKRLIDKSDLKRAKTGKCGKAGTLATSGEELQLQQSSGHNKLPLRLARGREALEAGRQALFPTQGAPTPLCPSKIFLCVHAGTADLGEIERDLNIDPGQFAMTLDSSEMSEALGIHSEKNIHGQPTLTHCAEVLGGSPQYMHNASNDAVWTVYCVVNLILRSAEQDFNCTLLSIVPSSPIFFGWDMESSCYPRHLLGNASPDQSCP